MFPIRLPFLLTFSRWKAVPLNLSLWPSSLWPLRSNTTQFPPVTQTL